MAIITRESTYEGVTLNLEINDGTLNLWTDEKELEPIACQVIPEKRFNHTHEDGLIEEFIEPESTEIIDHIWHQYDDALLEWGKTELQKLDLDIDVIEGNYCDTDWFPSYQVDLDAADQ